MKMSVQRCMMETTSTEFIDWMEFRRLDMNNPSRSDYYLAQITAELRRGNVKSPNKVRVEDFLLKFEPKTSKAKPLSTDEMEMRTQASKAVWAGIASAPRKPGSKD